MGDDTTETLIPEWDDETMDPNEITAVIEDIEEMEAAEEIELTEQVSTGFTPMTEAEKTMLFYSALRGYGYKD